jgi:small-conductance mechanosensitive channel
MDRLAALFEQFSIAEIAHLMRRAVFSAVAVGAIALVVTGIVGHILAGVGIGLGLGIGLVNIRLVTRSVSKVAASDVEKPKRVIATRAVYRLLGTTVVVIGLVVVSTTLGIATAGGIALFYLILVANLVRALLGGMTSPGVTA